MLNGIRTFLTKMSDSNDGFLLDGDFIKNSEIHTVVLYNEQKTWLKTTCYVEKKYIQNIDIR